MKKALFLIQFLVFSVLGAGLEEVDALVDNVTSGGYGFEIPKIFSLQDLVETFIQLELFPEDNLKEFSIGFEGAHIFSRTIFDDRPNLGGIEPAYYLSMLPLVGLLKGNTTDAEWSQDDLEWKRKQVEAIFSFWHQVITNYAEYEAPNVVEVLNRWKEDILKNLANILDYRDDRIKKYFTRMYRELLSAVTKDAPASELSTLSSQLNKVKKEIELEGYAIKKAMQHMVVAKWKKRTLLSKQKRLESEIQRLKLPASAKVPTQARMEEQPPKPTSHINVPRFLPQVSRFLLPTPVSNQRGSADEEVMELMGMMNNPNVQTNIDNRLASPDDFDGPGIVGKDGTRLPQAYVEYLRERRKKGLDIGGIDLSNFEPEFPSIGQPYRPSRGLYPE